MSELNPIFNADIVNYLLRDDLKELQFLASPLGDIAAERLSKLKNVCCTINVTHEPRVEVQFALTRANTEIPVKLEEVTKMSNAIEFMDIQFNTRHSLIKFKQESLHTFANTDDFMKEVGKVLLKICDLRLTIHHEYVNEPPIKTLLHYFSHPDHPIHFRSIILLYVGFPTVFLGFLHKQMANNPNLFHFQMPLSSEGISEEDCLELQTAFMKRTQNGLLSFPLSAGQLFAHWLGNRIRFPSKTLNVAARTPIDLKQFEICDKKTYRRLNLTASHRACVRHHPLIPKHSAYAIFWKEENFDENDMKEFIPKENFKLRFE
ncbi:hypothetical protein L596_013996 [Steinernema carpocapsae]|uniref:Uncharacterized protein n=1 Tax=Steinernema carpocapsae TaxID=34508 RepID=A0A4U5NBI7_STECR|nr:hypothetical protein L596_013996 [Steinernema carpocapsae]